MVQEGNSGKAGYGLIVEGLQGPAKCLGLYPASRRVPLKDPCNYERASRKKEVICPRPLDCNFIWANHSERATGFR